LRPESFDLEFDPATVTVGAAYSKRRREDVQPMRPDLAELVRDWLRDKQAGEKLWPENPDAPSESWNANAAEMVRADLQAAGIEYRDDDGRVFDFHALRHQFISNLINGGANPKDAQTLARHSTITLTADRYTHVRLSSQLAALDKLPPLPIGSDDYALAPTGTDAADRKPMVTEWGQRNEAEPKRMIAFETTDASDGQRRTVSKHLELQAIESESTRLRLNETNERAHSSTAEQGTHNPLVPGSNPGGPIYPQIVQPVGQWSSAHILRFPSAPPAARHLPSGEQAMAKTSPVCCQLLANLPFASSQSFTSPGWFQSPLPVKRYLPSGEKATDQMSL